MPTKAGGKGWLYEATERLVNKGVVLSISGDTPFLLRMLKGVSSDITNHSRLALYVEDPPEASDVFNSLKKGKDPNYNPRVTLTYTTFFIFNNYLFCSSENEFQPRKK